MNKTGLDWIGIKIYSNKRAVGKTTIAMTIVKILISFGYKVTYEGKNHIHSRMIEEQIKRTANEDQYIVDGITILVEDNA